MKKQTSVILLLQEMPIPSHILVCFVHIILIVQLRFLFDIPRKFHHLLSPVQPTFKLLNENCFRVAEVVQPSYSSFHKQKKPCKNHDTAFPFLQGMMKESFL